MTRNDFFGVGDIPCKNWQRQSQHQSCDVSWWFRSGNALF